MKQRARQLSIDEAQPGMTLAEDVLNPGGKMILPQGAVLTETSINGLRRYEVVQVVVALPDEEAAEEAAAERQRQLDRIARLFRSTDQSPTNAVLRQYLTRYRQGEAR